MAALLIVYLLVRQGKKGYKVSKPREADPACIENCSYAKRSGESSMQQLIKREVIERIR
jgi:hypothetical protein